MDWMLVILCVGVFLLALQTLIIHVTANMIAAITRDLECMHDHMHERMHGHAIHDDGYFDALVRQAYEDVLSSTDDSKPEGEEWAAFDSGE
jgi:hypothetical protein